MAELDGSGLTNDWTFSDPYGKAPGMVAANFEPEVDYLSQVTVRLLSENEVGQFNYYLESEHYLESSRFAGQSLRYVAQVDGQWVALLTFSAPALHLKGRERWIGWSPRQRARRLSLVVNNSRFLVLPERQRYPNLASRVLGLVLRRLSEDWQERWGHPVLVVESFVDESLYRGTCYRACGFQAVGPTEGFKRASRDFYQEHGQPKQLYLRELRKGACKRLRQARLPQELARHEAEVAGSCPFRAPALESLLERLGALRDSRRGHGLRHKQRFVLAVATVCTLMGACGYRAFENTSKKFTQRQLRALGCTPTEEDGRYYSPSDSTFQRVINNVDAVAVARIVGQWLAEQEIGALAQLAVDGKVLRGSGRQDGKPLQLLSAMTHQLRLTLDQVAIEEKSNEIPALKPLLKKIDLPPGVLITADAMHCQQESARFITQELSGDYLFGLKGNQSGIFDKAKHLLAQQGFPPSGDMGEGTRPV
ncbi:MAG TPA: ISAs1 family transposase [Verrucomicrobiota bacterium]|nr:ISAs1 family transposase [Verrucomicrobiota bacterium]